MSERPGPRAFGLRAVHIAYPLVVSVLVHKKKKEKKKYFIYTKSRFADSLFRIVEDNRSNYDSKKTDVRQTDVDLTHEYNIDDWSFVLLMDHIASD